MQQVANASNEKLECTTNGEKSDCDTVMCTTTFNGLPVIIELTVLPCEDLPAVHLIIEVAGRVVIDEVLSKSAILQNTVNVTLDQLDGAIGIQVRESNKITQSYNVILMMLSLF